MKLKDITTVSHVCAPEAYRDIFEHGLLTADQLLRAHGFSDEERVRLTHAPRPDFTYVPATAERGPARLAHNKPLLDTTGTRQQNLAASLEAEGCTLEEYCILLNTRTYFWADLSVSAVGVAGARRGYVEEMAAAGAFDVIRVPFSSLKRLASAHGNRIEVTRLNAGSAPQVGTSVRGPSTWTAVDTYPAGGDVQEVTVIDGLVGLGDVATQVIRVDADGVRSIWKGGPWK